LADGRNPADRERVLLSAVDFCTSATDLMYVAQYMSRSGFEARALKLFRQATLLEPTRAEPYMHGLTLASRLNDLEGIQWTTVGILRQAWPKDQAELWPKAHRLAAATLESLRKETQRGGGRL
jgi:hypothetical protein